MMTKRLRRLMSASAMAAVLMVPALAASLSGRVVDTTGSVTLEGARIQLLELGRTAESGPDGSFRFADVPPGTYTVRILYAGADAVERRVDITAQGDVAIDVAVGPQANEYGESVLVVGQRANLASSISRQRAAEGVESVLTRDAIGQFPDQNVAEAVRRAPGINVLNDQGEGRFVAVRGLDPELNAASINGQRVPAPEAGVRSVALDVVPSELIESIEIKKTLTPDMDADTIGASIEINTANAFDRKEGFFGLTVEGSYNDATEKYSPKLAFEFSSLLTDRLGITGGISYYQRRFATDNIEAEGWDIRDSGATLFEKLEYRDYDVERTRVGYTLGLDFKVDDDTTLYARGLHSIFEDQEDRLRLIFDLGDLDDAYAGSGDSASVRSDEDADNVILVERDIKDRYERQKITSLVTGGKTYLGDWTFDYSVAWSKASEKENGSLDPVTFAREFTDPGEIDITFDYRDRFRPGYTINGGLNDFLDPDGYEFDKVERTTLSLSEDEEVAYRFDATREIALDSGSLQIQGGVKIRDREKTYDGQFDIYDGYDGDLVLTDVLGRQSYGLGLIDPVPGRSGVRNFLRPNWDKLERDDYDSLEASLIEDYVFEEDIYAGYLLGRYENGPLKIVGGLRVEHTRTEATGNYVQLIEEGTTIGDITYDDDTILVSPNTFGREYTDWLPSIAVRYDVTSDVVLRGGVYRSVVRPTPGQLAPRFVVEENDENEREGSFGNPDLEPYEAWNGDISAEWYFAKNAVISGGLFYKSIENFIVEAEFEDVTFNGVFADEATIPINGDEADVFGFEFNLQSDLAFVDDMLDGFLIGLNYTYTDATGEVIGREIPLAKASEHTYNAMIGYEKDGFSARVAASYRSGYLDELGGSPDEDRYVKDHLQWDVSVKYRITPEAQIFAEFINIGDEPYIAYQKGPDGERLLQYEEYSWTGKAGFRLSF